MTLTTIGLIAPLLTQDNASELLTTARHKTKREVERLVAALRPLPPVPSSVRKLPAPVTNPPVMARAGEMGAERGTGARADAADAATPASAPDSQGDAVSTTRRTLVHARPAIVRPLAPERYKVQFTVSSETHDKLRRAQDLLRHVIPSGDPAAIFDRALTMLVAELEKTRLAPITC